MNYEVIPYQLDYKHPFRLAHTSRDHTPNAYLKVWDDKHTAYGEIVFPPYYPETLISFNSFLSKIELPQDILSINLEDYLQEIDQQIEGQTFAKAALDIALHNLLSKHRGTSIQGIYNISHKPQLSSFTIGISNNEEMASKVEEGDKFDYFKLKVSQDEITRIINYYRVLTDKTFVVDANQGFKDKEAALEWCIELKKMGVPYMEQPFDKDNWDDHKWLTERSPIPILADESFQRYEDITKIKSCFHGINVKLMKCTGIAEAYKCLIEAKAQDLLTVIGCMSESSVACNAAWQLSPLANWVDLDGPDLIKNDIDTPENPLFGLV